MRRTPVGVSSRRRTKKKGTMELAAAQSVQSSKWRGAADLSYETSRRWHKSSEPQGKPLGTTISKTKAYNVAHTPQTKGESQETIGALGRDKQMEEMEKKMKDLSMNLEYMKRQATQEGQAAIIAQMKEIHSTIELMQERQNKADRKIHANCKITNLLLEKRMEEEDERANEQMSSRTGHSMRQMKTELEYAGN